MQNEQIFTRMWDHAIPMGVSAIDHMQGLALMMVQIFFETGGKGVILSHPMTISMLICTSSAFLGKEFLWDGPTGSSIAAGRLGGVPIWANTAVRADEVLIVDDPEDLQPRAKIRLINFVTVRALDRLAQIR